MAACAEPLRRIDRRAMALCAALLAVLWLAHAVPYAFTTIILDTARDLVAAAAIADGSAWPLRGPVINAMLYLGPWWHYLLAVPLGLTGSTALTLLFAGMLAGSKFLFAYLCGARLHTRAFGVLWAVGLALPAWSVASGLLVTHTSLVEAALLASLWAALRVHEHARTRDWLLLGAALAAALHAHPTTVAAAPLLVAWALLRLRRHGVREVRGWLLCGMPVALSLLPPLIAEWQQGWPVLDAVGAYASGRQMLQGAPWALLWGAHAGGAAVLTDALLPHAASVPARWACIATAAVAAFGWVYVVRSGERALGGAIAAGYAAAAAIVWALRDVTAFYMTLALLPYAAAAWALGIAVLLRGRARAVAAAAIVLACALGLLQQALLVVRAEQGLIALPGARLSNVREPAHVNSLHATLPAWRLDRLGARLCGPDPIVLHTELALLVDASLALPTRLRCGTTDAIGIGGGAAQPHARHVLGLTPAWLRELGIADADWSATRRLAPDAVIAAAVSQSVPDGRAYPFRARTALPPLQRWRFTAAPDAIVLVAHLHQPYDGAHTVDVRAGGVPASPRFATWSTSAWRCTGCTAPVQWDVAAHADPERIDIVVVEPVRHASE